MNAFAAFSFTDVAFDLDALRLLYGRGTLKIQERNEGDRAE
jgi:hypothetical protein